MADISAGSRWEDSDPDSNRNYALSVFYVNNEVETDNLEITRGYKPPNIELAHYRLRPSSGNDDVMVAISTFSDNRGRFEFLNETLK